MGRLSRLAGAVQHWFLGPVHSASIAGTRFFLGLSLFLAYALRIPEFSLLYGADSVATFGPFRSFFPKVYGFPYTRLVEHWGAGYASFEQAIVIAVYVVVLVSALAFLFGAFTRTSGSLLLLGHLFLLSLDPFAYWGWSQMVLPLLLFTVVAPSARCLSVDAWQLRKRAPEQTVSPWMSAWPQRLVQLHVASMYAEAGFSRVDEEGWQQGVMLQHALTNRHFARFAVDWSEYSGVLRVLCFAVFILEPAAAILLWIPRVRVFIALSLIGMHVGLETLTRVGFWNGVLIGGLLTFLPLERWLGSRLGNQSVNR